MAGAVVMLAGCGSGGSAHPGRGAAAPSDVHASEAALRAAGWRVREVAGMPHTVSGASQTGYLETTSPDGSLIDVQFFANAPLASGEAATAERRLHGFHAIVVGDTIAFSRGTGQHRLSAASIRSLQSALH